MNAPAEIDRGITLNAFLARVSDTLEGIPPVWVIAEVSKVTHSKSLMYLELREESGNTITQATGRILPSVLSVLLQSFQNAGLDGIQEQHKYRLLLSPKLQRNGKLVLEVHEADVNYTLGDAEARKQMIINALKHKGHWDKNKLLPPPTGFWRVAVISPAGAAGLADFRQEADAYQRHGVCFFEYFTATFQGSRAAGEIAKAIETVNLKHKQSPYDVMCIIRGGGSKSDLFYLNDYKCARFICGSHLPVFTGIGHQTDDCILDQVAFRKFDTPSKVIAALRSHFQQEAAEVETSISKIETALTYRVEREFGELDRGEDTFRSLMRGVIIQEKEFLLGPVSRALNKIANSAHEEEKALIQTAAHFQTLIKEQISNAQNDLFMRNEWFIQATDYIVDNELRTLALDATRFIDRSRASLEHAARELDKLSDDTYKMMLMTLHTERLAMEKDDAVFQVSNPMAVLEKGYALVTDGHGTQIKNATMAATMEELTLQFADAAVKTRRSPPSG